MLRLLVLCLALTFVNSRLVIERNFPQRDPLDDWTHLEANYIPTSGDGGYDFFPAELLFSPIRPDILVADGEEQPGEEQPGEEQLAEQSGEEQPAEEQPAEEQPADTTYSYDVTDLPMHTYLPTDVVEENENSTLPDFTEDSDGYLLFPGIGRFKLHDEDRSWNLAREQCVREGGDLAIPDSEQKVAVFMKMYEMYPDVPATAILRQQVYIGIQDPEDTREFVTVKGDPVRLDLPLWAPGEPDNQDPGEEDCVTFRTDARIRDVPCHFYLPFFCEKPL